MIFTETELSGAWIIDIERHSDERGFFARTWCRREFEEHGLSTDLAQCSTSFSARAGTLRGMHFQRPPHDEVKLVRCTAGAIWDVIIDLRPHSPTYRRWQGFELGAASHRTLYVPRGFAHGFQTLCDETEVAYQISTFHVPAASAGLRHDDPAFTIAWPLPVTVISGRDVSWPDYAPTEQAAMLHPAE
jgi:dTDP-4-dehydrorhamnose 3,5-epimerase